ncbi:N-6 DNA methylase [Roseiterribacter gracilis]|uniref:DNA methylase adenine-specific domain-containing protein n=1 Tax=Roseiterribacter gracilis TaxID=2812848 RepID=A0A8S8X9N2_9PROT|nr:hypothetical protein TMPK1_02740 [Rhodospirillales bacterium TMPK1]
MATTAFSAHNLVRDFCTGGLLHRLARALHQSLAAHVAAPTQTRWADWETLFRLSHEDLSQQRRIDERRRVLGALLATDLKDPKAEYAALFALHTAYAILVKLIAWRVTTDGKAQHASLRDFCATLEDGSGFRGVTKLCEGDFFAWYADPAQWTDAIAASVQEMLAVLARYDDPRTIFVDTHAVDLFRPLYEATVPQVVRVSFGEFYTPLWLAQHVVRATPRAAGWTALDPCCGSGTFVIAAIGELRRELAAQPLRDAAREILRRVHGLDLNPLAVLTARVHYLIHIADLLDAQDGDVTIPVFLGDASSFTTDIGTFTTIVGNPPWVDWKSLPAGYREKIKTLCIDRGLFSGAGRTGGINLNICALITHVAASNWLAPGGSLAFLMPKELANQASYEGWRRTVGGADVALVALHDWSRAGHPFDPVKEDFLTFLFEARKADRDTVAVRSFAKTGKARSHAWTTLEDAETNLTWRDHVAGQLIEGSTAYTIADDQRELDRFRKIAGHCAYKGREGVEFYPQELMLFTYDGPGPTTGTVWVKNVQVARSKYRIPQQRVLLETTYLFPLAKGPGIGAFDYDDPEMLVAFPYDASNPHAPLSQATLEQTSPLLLAFYRRFKTQLENQTAYSDSIRGDGEFYGVARTGPYSFMSCYVAYRDNSKWCATVLTTKTMPWGEEKRFLFQNHAVSICERSKTQAIDLDEAYFIAGIFNTGVVRDFIYATSDNRSFKIRPPVHVPLFDKKNATHAKIAALAQEAHRKRKLRAVNLAKIETAYLKLCDGRVKQPTLL